MQQWPVGVMAARAKEADYGDMPVVRLRLDFITSKGKMAYKELNFSSSGSLGADSLERLVGLVEKDFDTILRKDSTFFED